MQPRGEARVLPEPMQPFEGDDKRVLRQVASEVRVASKVRQPTGDGRRIGFVDRLQRGIIGLAGSLKDKCIRDRKDGVVGLQGEGTHVRSLCGPSALQFKNPQEERGTEGIAGPFTMRCRVPYR